MRSEEMENLYQDFLERKMDWDEAIKEAKEELGVYGYTENWDEVVETAKDIIQEEYDEFYDELLEIAHIKYQEYLKSDVWKRKRFKILTRDNFTCKDCNNKATEVHHLDYNHLGTNQEEKDCISVCKNCHLKRHKIQIK